MQSDRPAVILASASPTRARLLTDAGIDHRVDAAHIDEAGVKEALCGESAPAGDIAATLAELKARQVAPRWPSALVIGADQILECGGVMFDKPVDLAHARGHLMGLRDKTHSLHSAVCVFRGGELAWQHVARAELEMWALSDRFIDDYLERVGPAVCGSVGAYRLEGLGAQLFRQVRGDYFAILGLPLLALLGFLRNHDVVAR